MNFDIEKISAIACYRLLIGAVVPRPIAWVSTLSESGVANLAPYSFFTVASCAPPVLAFVQVIPRDNTEKDTLRNLRQTKQCVVNVVSAENAEVMNASCADYPSDISEFDAVGIPFVASHSVSPPGVANAQVRFECTLREIQCIANQPMGGNLILLDVVNIFVDDAVLRDGNIDTMALDAIGRLAGDSYANTRQTFDLARPMLTKPLKKKTP